MEYVLVKFEANWCDEFYVNGFGLYEKSQWIELVNKFNKTEKLNNWGFGTNQFFDISELEDDWLQNFEVIDIIDHEYQSFKNRFGLTFGTFFDIQEYLKWNK